MLPELLATANAYATGSLSLDNLIKGFTEADWAVRDACGHDPRWIVGHLATSRNRLAGLMGLQITSAPWEAAFGRGSSPGDIPVDLNMEEVIAMHRTAHAMMVAHWDDLTPETLAKPMGRTLPNGTDTVGGAIHFLAWHEAYHLGQLAILRRLVGRPGLA